MAEATRSGKRSNAIAIVGMSGRFPDAANLEQFWQNIRNGVESLADFSDADLDSARVPVGVRSSTGYVRRGTVLDGADHFDAAFFGYSPREAQILDPQQRIFLECAWEALENAGYAGASAGQSVGVYAGVGINTYLLAQLLANPAFVEAVGGYQLMIGNDKDFLSTRVSYKLDLRGPSITVQTACSTSLVAVVLACRALQRGECDLALAGGVAVLFPQKSGYMYEEGMIFSPDGHCRPFDEQAHGTRGGSGAGIVVLKRLDDAIADRDTIHAVLLGAAMNNDGAGKAGYTAPSVDGQVEVIATAQALAGVEPRSIGYIEAHGTATPLGDPIEIAALTQVFAESCDETGFCRIGSLKANIGHLDAAAGVAGLIKTVLALEHHELPPLVNFQRANPRLSLDASPFAASATAAPWTSPTGTPRRAGVSSFGIGGTNAHVVVEEGPRSQPSASTRDRHLLVLSAKTPDALDRATANLVTYLSTHPDTSLNDVEYTLEVGRHVFAHRRAVVVRDAAHALELLGALGRAPVINGTYEGGARSIAFLFSGQGSQHVGMGADLYRTERVYRDAFDHCATILEPHLGRDIREIVFGAADDTTINETRYTQPALFAAEYALAQLWMARGVQPAAMLGHSIGEYVAAHLAGVMSLDDALAVVAARGRLMQALPAGRMAAVSLHPTELTRVIAEFPGVEIAAVNAPELCTVSGPAAAIEALGLKLSANGGGFRALHTSHAFHSAMMEPALAPFTAIVEGISLSAPRVPYVSNLTGTWITDEEATSPAYYAQHLRHAVRFEAGVRILASEPTTLLLEVGPGNALTSLARMTVGKDASARVFSSLSHPRDRRSDVESTLEATGRMWLAGAEIDWEGLHADSAPHRIPLPTYPFDRKRYWVDASPVEATAQSPMAPSAHVDEWFFAPTWSRDDVRLRSPKLAGTWLVFTTSEPLSAAVVNAARDAGANVITIDAGVQYEQRGTDRYVVRPGNPDDLSKVVNALAATGARISGAIDLRNTTENDESGLVVSHHALVTSAAAFESQRSADDPMPIIVATVGAQSVLDASVRFPARAAVIGPVLALPLEIPTVRLRAVDLDLGEASSDVERAAAGIVEEAAMSDRENVVARRSGRRWVRRIERVAVPASRDDDQIMLKPRGVYLITGGLGGIGVTIAEWLARHTSARLLLTSRTPLPERAEWDAWLASHPDNDRTSMAVRAVRRIEEAGGEVIVASADAADEGAMRNAIERARERWGVIDGVVHAAGVAGNGRLSVLTSADDVDAVVDPKVGGLAVLRTLLGDTDLDFVVLISSINSLFGAAGLADYASANAMLDAFVESSQRPARWNHVAAINYGPWRDIGMASRIFEKSDGPRAATEDFRRAAIPPAEGVEAFARILRSGRPQVIVARHDLPRLMELARLNAAGPATRTAAPEPSAATSASSASSSADTDGGRPGVSTNYEPPASDDETRMAKIWSELLGVERIGANDDFFELGGHSLLATRVLARIDQGMGVRLALRDVFDAPTLRTLAARVGAARPNGGAAPGAADSDREELEF